MKTKAFIQKERKDFLPPSFLWLIRTHWGFSGHRKLPSAVCLEVGSTPAFMAPNSPPTSWYTSPSQLSHRSQNPSPWKIWLSQYESNGHGFGACILKYKESLRGLSEWPLLWFVFTSQPGLLIPRLSGCICNKLCCGLCFFFFLSYFETQMNVTFLSYFLMSSTSENSQRQHSDFMKKKKKCFWDWLLSNFQISNVPVLRQRGHLLSSLRWVRLLGFCLTAFRD